MDFINSSPKKVFINANFTELRGVKKRFSRMYSIGETNLYKKLKFQAFSKLCKYLFVFS